MKKKLVLIIIFGITILFIFSVIKSIFSLYQSGSRLKQEQTTVDNLSRQHQSLQANISQAQEKGYIEKVAHDQLNMVIPGEQVIVIPHNASADANQQNTIQTQSNWQRWCGLFFGR